MPARIYKPSKTAMQSGFANTKAWLLDFEPEVPRQVEPLMGWTSSADMRQQLRLRFDSKEEAVAYCERHGIAYHVFETAPLNGAQCPTLIIFPSSVATRGLTKGNAPLISLAASRFSGRLRRGFVPASPRAGAGVR